MQLGLILLGLGTKIPLRSLPACEIWLNLVSEFKVNRKKFKKKEELGPPDLPSFRK